ncbi:MAG TPA: response regulator transcription factor [Nocardioidaceae bacterium]
MTTILVAEDADDLAEIVRRELSSAGYEVIRATTGRAALAIHQRERPALVVLDWMLPELDGLAVLREVRAGRDPALSSTPVIMLTARGDEADRVIGLEVGADDYLTKPFSMRELVARVRALLRRVERAAALATAGPAELSVGPLHIDRARRQVRLDGSLVHLTPTEFDLLACLASEPGTVLTRERLLADVWDWPDAAGTRTVDSHVRSLRGKLGADVVRTVHGVGYALEVTP